MCGYDVKGQMCLCVPVHTCMTCMYIMCKRRVSLICLLGDLAYHTNLVDLLTMCTEGKNVATEIKCTSLLPLDEIVRVVTDWDCIPEVCGWMGGGDGGEGGGGGRGRRGGRGREGEGRGRRGRGEGRGGGEREEGEGGGGGEREEGEGRGRRGKGEGGGGGELEERYY